MGQPTHLMNLLTPIFLSFGGKRKMSRNKKRAVSERAESKTMSTLQMWQQQMAALQRASQAREDDHPQANAEEQQSEHLHSSSGLVFPHLP